MKQRNKTHRILSCAPISGAGRVTGVSVTSTSSLPARIVIRPADDCTFARDLALITMLTPSRCASNLLKRATNPTSARSNLSAVTKQIHMASTVADGD
jgi:hypothetical protein